MCFKFTWHKPKNKSYLDLNKKRINKLSESDRQFFMEMYYNASFNKNNFAVNLLVVIVAIMAIFFPLTQISNFDIVHVISYIFALAVILYIGNKFFSILRGEDKKICDSLDYLLNFLENKKKI